MTIETGVLIAAAGLLLAVLTYAAGTKTKSNAEGVQFGRVLEKLDQLEKKIDRLENVYDHVDEKIAEHEKRHHKGG